MFSKEEKELLLNLARNTIRSQLDNEHFKCENSIKKIFPEKCGAFTTLKLQDQLRGCIGYIIGEYPLWRTIQETAVQSAFNDPRFYPLTKEEFKHICIEISILTPPVESKHEDIVMGKHGVIVEKDWHKGVFLPQVAEELGNDKEVFMNYLCKQKAGLPENAWKSEDIKIYTFEAIIIAENIE